jgi:hypothetical protein
MGKVGVARNIALDLRDYKTSKYIDGLEVSEESDEESKSMRFGSNGTDMNSFQISPTR